ncbi:MAG: hypothetical protein H7174_01595 [Flavobacterium sp.]|nr:hypothetical protein [Flavobacterium sp.]
MSTNREVLLKGVKYLSGALPLFFLGPIVIYNSQMNLQSKWHYLVLIIGIMMCFGAMFLMFFGIKTIMKSMFDK